MMGPVLAKLLEHNEHLSSQFLRGFGFFLVLEWLLLPVEARFVYTGHTPSADDWSDAIEAAEALGL